MKDSSEVISRLLEELTKLPGIGPKSAERIAHFLLAGDRRNAADLAEALQTAVSRVRPCRECYNLADAELCPVCSDSRRDAGLICVVESPRDVGVFERMGSYRGLYHVLGGRLSALEGVRPEDLAIDALVPVRDMVGPFVEPGARGASPAPPVSRVTVFALQS